MGRPAKKPRGAFGARLVVLREAAGLTQHQLADRLKVHQTNIAFWERWDKAPRGEVLPDLAKQLGVTVDELLGVAPPKPKRQPAAKGRLQKVFESASKLPRRQQDKVAEFLEAFVEHQKGGS
jgi:transcriptional regulator with XRE-family HTH domain